MSSCNEDLSELIANAKVKYNEYALTQKDFQMPEAHISIESEGNERTKVHIEVQYKGTEYQFESIEEKDTNDVHRYLNSQSSVREKYADGNATSLESTIARVKTLAYRFEKKSSPLYLYSGLILSDAQTETFLGMVVLGGGIELATSEMAFLNRSECWSRSNNITSPHMKIYSGVGTVETCTLLQYATKLKEEGYLINGHQLKAVVATARVDNEGSWKSCAKAGMTLDNLDVVNRYGNKLRYQLRKDISSR